MLKSKLSLLPFCGVLCALASLGWSRPAGAAFAPFPWSCGTTCMASMNMPGGALGNFYGMPFFPYGAPPMMGQMPMYSPGAMWMGMGPSPYMYMGGGMNPYFGGATRAF